MTALGAVGVAIGAGRARGRPAPGRVSGVRCLSHARIGPPEADRQGVSANVVQDGVGVDVRRTYDGDCVFATSACLDVDESRQEGRCAELYGNRCAPVILL